MKILLTGASGFLGTYILDYFLKKNCKVIITRRASTNLNKISQHFGIIETWDTKKLDELFLFHPDINLIVHAATDYGRDNSMPTSIFWSNETFPMKLIENAIRLKINFINFDTFFNSEETSYNYLGAYTLSKRHFQEWGKHFANLGHISFYNLKLFHLYGPNDSSSKFIPSIISRCLVGDEIDLTDGMQRRDFIYITDVVDALEAVLKFIELKIGSLGYYNFDVGTGVSISIRELVELVKKLCHSSSKLNFGALSSRNGEFQNSYADNKNLMLLSWEPKVRIEEGIQYILDELK